jgi:phosphatidylglycerophosphate synthase
MAVQKRKDASAAAAAVADVASSATSKPIAPFFAPLPDHQLFHGFVIDGESNMNWLKSFFFFFFSLYLPSRLSCFSIHFCSWHCQSQILQIHWQRPVLSRQPRSLSHLRLDGLPNANLARPQSHHSRRSLCNFLALYVSRGAGRSPRSHSPSSICYWKIVPTFGTTTSAEPWVYFLVGTLLWAYQAFDNMDGKQARRTGSSSALGELVCNAIHRCLRVVLTCAFVWCSLITFATAPASRCSP